MKPLITKDFFCIILFYFGPDIILTTAGLYSAGVRFVPYRDTD